MRDTATTGTTETSRSSSGELREGRTARAIEHETAKLPSDWFLWSALGAMGASICLHIAGQKHAGLFVGQWAAPFLLFGIYNKLVKLGGSGRFEQGDGSYGDSYPDGG